MNYFDARYTNAYTESVNNLIKRLKNKVMDIPFNIGGIYES